MEAAGHGSGKSTEREGAADSVPLTPAEPAPYFGLKKSRQNWEIDINGIIHKYR